MTAVNASSKASLSLLVAFWILVAAFSALILTILLPNVLPFFRSSFLGLVAVCFLVGLVLLILAVRWRARSLLRTF